MPLSISLPSPTFARDDFLTPIAELLPLPPESYPRVIDQRKPDRGYYLALCLILIVWIITPLSCVYLLWFTIFGPGLTGSGKANLTTIIFAAYALTEVVFAIYHYYLIHHVQAPAPPSELPLDIRFSLFHKVLHAGLSTRAPELPTLSSSYGQDGYFANAQQQYQAGHISLAELRHAKDHEYEDSVGIGRPRRRVGEITEADRSVLDAFVEENEGDRERRLRREIETGETGMERAEQESLEDSYGNPIMLHAHDRRAVEFRERMRTWFNHAPWESLRRQNVLIWLSWSCFNLPLEEAKKNKSYVAYLDKTIRFLEARTGMTVPEGHDSTIQTMRLTLDPVNAKGRPLILYALSNTINAWLRGVVYPHQGMSSYKEGGIEYLIRIPPGWTPNMGQNRGNCIPVVYLQGLGFGLLQSQLLIKHLIKSLPTHPLLIPIPPHTSQSVFDPRHLRPWSRRELVETMKRICIKWGFWEAETDDRPERGGVSMLSHSNGSVGHSWLLKDCPSLIRRSTFVDPVVFINWEGDLAWNFCYRPPKTALELLLFYFIASEVGIANYIQRHFDWADNTLFFDDIPNGRDPRKTAFFLGGKDIIIDAPRTRRYLESHGVTARGLHWDSNAGHGDGLSGDSRHRVVKYVGTGSTRGWEGWVKTGRHRHSMGAKDWRERQEALGLGLDSGSGSGGRSPSSGEELSPLEVDSARDSVGSELGLTGMEEMREKEE